jgi:hypothetical protein
MGWGGFVRKPKTKAELAAERRRELGEKYFSAIAELQAMVAKCRMKPKKFPPAPHPDDIITDPRAVSHRTVSVTRREHEGAARRVGREGRRAVRRSATGKVGSVSGLSPGAIQGQEGKANLPEIVNCMRKGPHRGPSPC